MAFRLCSAINKFIFFILAATLIISLNSCSNNTSDTNKKSVKVETVVENKKYTRGELIAGNDVYIGVAWPFSKKKGRNELIFEGAEYAADEINKNGGLLKKRLTIIRGDDEQDLKEAKNVARDFASNKDLIAVIGHNTPTTSLYAAVTYDINEIIYFAVRAPSASLTKHKLQFLFRIIPTDQDVVLLAISACKKLNIKNIAVINTLDDYGKDQSAIFKTEAIKADFNIVAQFSFFRSDNIDYRKIASKVKEIAKEIDLIFYGGTTAEAIEIIKELRDMDIKIPIVGGESLYTPDFVKKLGKKADNVFVITYNDEGIYENNSEFIKFAEGFKKKYNKKPEKFAIQGYECVKIIEHIARLAKTFKTSALTSFLVHKTETDLFTKKYDFDDKGDIINKNLSAFVVHNGKFERLDMSDLIADTNLIFINKNVSNANILKSGNTIKPGNKVNTVKQNINNQIKTDTGIK